MGHVDRNAYSGSGNFEQICISTSAGRILSRDHGSLFLRMVQIEGNKNLILLACR